MCVSSFLASNLFACSSNFTDQNFWQILIFLVFWSYVIRVQNESPIHIFNAEMFATPSTMFKLPSYVVELAHLLAETPSPPPSPIRLVNKLVLDFPDIEAEQGEDSDRHGILNYCLRLVRLEPPSHMYCFCLIFL